ncbi:MAG TPA: nucleoside-diphosphate kinase, partial [Halieaceae bacterium]|nr:nucleoside-diphosphate kinase [Halieaceae bacterium]
ANAVHGSDSPASAEREIAYFFAASDLCGRG